MTITVDIEDVKVYRINVDEMEGGLYLYVGPRNTKISSWYTISSNTQELGEIPTWCLPALYQAIGAYLEKRP